MSHKNVLTKCPNCGAELSIELAEEAAEEHAGTELTEKEEPESLRDTLTKVMT